MKLKLLINTRFVCLLISLSLLSCATTETTASKEDLVKIESKVSPFELVENFESNASEIPTPNSIFALTGLQQEDFLNFFYASENAIYVEHKRLYKYLEDKLYGFTYLGSTRNASEALRFNEGNCLSLAILTTALADLVNLKVTYQQVNSAPIYLKNDQILTVSSHVRSYIHRPDRPTPDGEKSLTRGWIIIDYFPSGQSVNGRMVSKEEFIAKYYQNLAANALNENDWGRSYKLLEMGYKLSNYNPETLNTLAVLYSKIGEIRAAKKVYEMILNDTKGSIHAISNYADLLRREGDVKQADLMMANIANVYDDNPYRWIQLGNEQLQNGSVITAEKYLKRALELGPYLHESYLGMAKLYFTKKQNRQAREALKLAHQHAFLPEDQKLYRAKLMSLND